MAKEIPPEKKLSSPVKIALIIPSLQAGGMERVMTELMHHYSNKELLEIHLILYGIKRDIFYKIPENVIVHKPSFTFNNRYRFYYTLKTLLYLRGIIRRLQPNSILSFGELWNNFVLLALYGTNFLVYVSDRCQPDKKLAGFHEKLRKWLYPRAAGVIVQTERAKEIYKKKLYHNNIKVIPNPIRPLDTKDTPERENIVLSVGRLISTKHHDELIGLFVELNRSNWTLIIVGGDALKQSNSEKLKALIKELGVEDRIILAGSVKDVTSYYRRSKIFAFTSSSEGFPNVIGEALAAGLPVVAFDCIAGPSDMVIDGDNGHLIELFDYKAFSRALAKLMDDEGYRKKLASNAKESIKKYNSHVIAEEYYRLIIGKLENTPN